MVNLTAPVRIFWQYPNDDELSRSISLEQACKTYYYSRNAILSRIKKGKTRGFKIGSRWFVVPLSAKNL